MLFVLASGGRARPVLALRSRLRMAAGEADREITVSGIVERTLRVDAAQLELSHITIQNAHFPIPEAVSRRFGSSQYKVLVYFSNETPVSAGEAVILSGMMAFPEPATTPGQFDFALDCESKGIVLLLQKAQLIARAQQPSALHVLERLRYVLEDRLFAVLPDEDAAMMSAMLLGDRTMLSPEQKTLYQEGGIFHILAISGLHVSMIGMGLWNLLRKRRAGFLPCSLVTGSVMTGYVLLTGGSLSAKRALLMFVIWCGAQVAGRAYDRATALCLSALCLALPNPVCLITAGFWLSFGCIASLLLLPDSLKQGILHLFGTGRISTLLTPLIPGLSIFLGTLPLQCYFYYQISPWSVLVNLMVLPLLSLLCAGCGAAALIGSFYPAAGTFLGGSSHLILAFFSLLCRAERQLPGSILITGCPKLWQIGVYYGLLGVLILGIKGRLSMRWKGTPLAGMIAAAGLLTAHPAPSFAMTIVDVGQGDGIVMESQGQVLMVDCGSSSMKDVWGSRMERILKYKGIRQVDAVFVTHADADHRNGIDAWLSGYAPVGWSENPGGIRFGALFTSRALSDDVGLSELADAADALHIPVHALTPGEQMTFGGLQITVLYPSEDDIAAISDVNERSLVLEADYRNRISVLLTGDLEGEGEAVVAARLGESARPDEVARPGDATHSEHEGTTSTNDRLTVLKVGHHGSANATGEALLHAFPPDIALISCGRNNRYGHPAPAVLDRLADAKTDVYRTDMLGTLTLWAEGTRWGVEAGC